MLSDRPFPDLLRFHRLRAGLTQRALAGLSTISPRTIRDLEAGRANARTQTVRLLADALRLQGLPHDLFIDAGVGGRLAGPPGADLGTMVRKPVNAFVGRDAEVRVLVDALASGSRRMIALSGLPGVGKSRVAAETAARMSARRGWPVVWVGTEEPAFDRHGAAFGPLLRSLRVLIESGTRDVSQVQRLVGRHEVLVVLDGVADGRTPLGVEELLAYCPGVRVISTSRVSWHVAGVQGTVVSPMATPGPEWDAVPVVDSLAGVPSVQLLVERLSEVRPEFALGQDDAGAVVEVCRRLDGLPLALEAVAGLFSVLSLRQLAEVPTVDLLDLTTPTRSGGPTASGGGAGTIGGLVGSVVDLLDDRHRSILRELAAFERSWTVTEVAGLLRRPLTEVVDDLGVFIGCGLVRAAYGEPVMTLHVPNLLRAVLAR
ncbi:helix-turn-helix domain-containing protein [Streptomyces sp. QTS52]